MAAVAQGTAGKQLGRNNAKILVPGESVYASAAAPRSIARDAPG